MITLIFRYDEIRNVSFERSGGSTRSFDISVLTNNDIGYTFSSIEKNEYQKLYDYFKNKKITVKAQGSGGKGGTLNFDEDDKVDHYLEGKVLSFLEASSLSMKIQIMGEYLGVKFFLFFFSFHFHILHTKSGIFEFNHFLFN